jgi:probable selenium-dependent hydroxylase accessory protein YqeC
MGFPALAGTVVPHAIHRYDRFTELFGGDVTALSTDVIARLLAHHQGSFVGAPDGARRCWLINQVAGDEAFRRALSFADEVCDRLQGSGAIDDVIVGAVQSELPLMHRVLTDRPATLRTEEP